MLFWALTSADFAELVSLVEAALFCAVVSVVVEVVVLGAAVVLLWALMSELLVVEVELLLEAVSGGFEVLPVPVLGAAVVLLLGVVVELFCEFTLEVLLVELLGVAEAEPE